MASSKRGHHPEARESPRVILALVLIEVHSPGFLLYSLGWIPVLLVQHGFFHWRTLDHGRVPDRPPRGWSWVDLLHPGWIPKPQPGVPRPDFFHGHSWTFTLVGKSSSSDHPN